LSLQILPGGSAVR